MNKLGSTGAVHAAAIELPPLAIPSDPALGGDARTATTVLGEFAGVELGVWEMAPGVMRDVEDDEVFIVLSGSAVVEFADGSAPLHLSAGDVVRLEEGTETVWTVTETIRKVYLQQP